MKNTELQRQRDLLSLTEHAIAQQEDQLQGAKIAADQVSNAEEAEDWRGRCEAIRSTLAKYKTWREEAKAKINQLQN